MDQANKYLDEERDRLQAKLAEARKLIMEPGMEEMAKDEVAKIEKEIENIDGVISNQGSVNSEEIQSDNFNSVIIEIRPGVGGDEAKIWAEDLLRMYTRYTEFKSQKSKVKSRVEVIDSGVIKIIGGGWYKRLKWETGVHRVQRVPTTEAQGRIHTSTASVVVLPEIAEKEIEIREDDLIWEFTRGGGHGGQNVNKVATAVRLTHKPSGLVVGSRQERSQEQNRKIALSLLRSQLWEIEQEKKSAEINDHRSKIGKSMRAEKIRTYNYPQNRVTDHRIGKSWYKLDRIIEGDLDEVLDALAASEFTDEDTDSDNQRSGD